MQTGQVVLRIGFYTLAAWGLVWSLLAVGDMSPRDGRGGQAPRQAEAQSASVRVDGFRFGHREGGGIRFVMELSQAVPWRVFAIGSPYRVVIDLPIVEWDSGGLIDGLGFVANARYGRFSQDRSRIVLDLSQAALPEATFTLPRDGGGRRLVVDLAPVAESAFPEKLETLFESEEGFAKTKRRADAPPLPLLRPALGARGKWVVVIDAGHGGVDVGAISATKKYEKNLVLSYAKDLRNALNATGEFDAVLTRNDDRFIPLRERISIAEALGGDIFLSLHADANPSRKVRGASVYTLSEKASDKEATALAARENRSDILAGIDLTEHTGLVSQILIDLSQRDAINASQDYANLLVTDLRESKVRTLQRAKRSAGFAVLKSPNMPSVLVEIGHISNADEEKYLNSKEGRKEVINVLVSSLRQFFRARTEE